VILFSSLLVDFTLPGIDHTKSPSVLFSLNYEKPVCDRLTWTIMTSVERFFEFSQNHMTRFFKYSRIKELLVLDL
jgi:hypothetical protein